MEGKKTGPSPVDRGKIGTKRSILCDAKGIPLALAVHAASTHDSMTIEDLLDGACFDMVPKQSVIFFDKGYDSEHLREAFELLKINAIIPRRYKKRGRPHNIGKHRWVIERTFSWINRFGKAVIRREKKLNNYLGVLMFCSAWIILRKVLSDP